MNNVIDFPTLNGNTQFEDVPITMLNDEAIGDHRIVWDMDSTVCMGVADGYHPLRYTALNHDSDNSDEWFFYSIESHDLIRVVDGHFDVASVQRVAQHLMEIAGYHGVYVEALEYNIEGEYFELVMGS